MTEIGAVVVVEERTPSPLGVYLKAAATGRLYRVEPARDPAQPRFWCLRVYRCTRAGVADGLERPWLGGGGMTRDDLPAALRAIRDDVDAWLAAADRQPLRRWLLEPEVGGLELGVGKRGA